MNHFHDIFLSLESVQAIKVIVRRGKGDETDLIRNVTQYYSPTGSFLAEYDPCPNGVLPKPNPDFTPSV